MPAKVGNIEVYMGPDTLQGPDDLKALLVRFIDAAKKKLFIAVQELDHQDIAEAIIRARKRGVTVKLVLEGDYLTETCIIPNPFQPAGEHEINRKLHDAILRSRVKVNSDFNPDIFHQKFMVRDGESVLTGSANFTETDTSANLNHIVVVHDPDVAKEFEKEFSEIQEGHFGKLNEGHDPTPKEKKVSGVRVKVLFAPDHNPEMEIMKQIAKAKERVDFVIFTFAKSSGIDDQLLLAKKVGLKIRGAFFKSQANQSWSALEALRKEKLKLFLVPKDGLPEPKPRKLHHKLMVIDSQLIIAGSFNYTSPANMTNDENIIILGDLDETSQGSVQKQKQLADYALKEVNRIIDAYGEPA